MKRKNIFLFLLFLGLSITGFNQVYNTDPNQNYINVSTPGTPESAGFDKYDAARVNEFTGTASIGIPIYTLKSQFLELPITLTYQATGIKVNQEASWVGLGWDLNAGGRITVEIKGSADFNSITNGLSSPTILAAGMQRVYNRLNLSLETGENAVMTPATLCQASGACPNDTNFYDPQAFQEMCEFGTGEPDIFRANFMGHSLTYYVDKIDHTIKFIGEQSFFKINYTLDTYNNITNWTLVDDDGITYYFNQPENTTFTLPANPVTPASTTTAWLLTKIVHPSGDYIQFTYTNYGYIVPAFTMSGSVDWNVNVAGATLSNDQDQNIALQSPYYLTKIETSNSEVDFSLSNRSDLYGATNASKKLDKITVLDKITGSTVKTATFNYSYFHSSINHNTHLDNLSYYLPSPLTTTSYLACSNDRLRLDSVSINLSTLQPAYRFYYNSLVPNKYDYGQDHWGYYNGVGNANNGGTFTHLIPYSGIGGVGNDIPAADLNTANIGYSRDCDPVSVQAMMLTKVVYPTGGSSSFTYEPHQSTMVPTTPVTGGGLRVKTIQNYEGGNLLNTTTYTYSGGKYMGTINYFTTVNIEGCASGSGSQGHMKYSSQGSVNFNDILIGYNQISIQQTDISNNSNGYIIKTFNTNTPSSNYSNTVGFDIAPPYYPPSELDWNPGKGYDFWMDPTHKNFPPTPSANLEGKLMQEQYFDASNVLIKSINYYYHLANYLHPFYDIIAMLERTGGFDGTCDNEFTGGYGERPVYLFVSPSKSYHTLTDSVIELTYSGSSSIKKKTAYTYNTHYQPMFETIYNSDGTQTINYTRTSAEIYVPGGGGYSGTIANQMYQMFNQHILDLPIEQTVIHRGTAGDSTVVSSRFNVYQNALPLQTYTMESQSPLTLRTQFTPWFYSSVSPYSVNIDSHYSLYSSADYSTRNMIETLHTLQGNKAFIWDEGYNTVLAQCNNTDSSNIAFTSFETQAKGRWTYNSSGVVTDNTAPTGSKAYNLATANITLTSLTSATTYIVSYWTKTASSYTVTGSTSVKKGRTVNGWTYYEHTVTGASTVTISGSGSIDEVRLYPSDTQMISYTYLPLIGISSECNANSQINYYFYDAIGRLAWIKDQDGNIIKTFQYHYQGLLGAQF
jgi:hypothetical protein